MLSREGSAPRHGGPGLGARRSNAGKSARGEESGALAPARRDGPASLPVMIPLQVHLQRPCYDFYFL